MEEAKKIFEYLPGSYKNPTKKERNIFLLYGNGKRYVICDHYFG
jgi:hypothetical protein